MIESEVVRCCLLVLISIYLILIALRWHKRHMRRFIRENDYSWSMRRRSAQRYDRQVGYAVKPKWLKFDREDSPCARTPGEPL